MKEIALFLSLTVFPKLVWAEAISIQYTEHESYTRLVIPLTNVFAWEAEEFPGGLSIRFESQSSLVMSEIEEISSSKRISSSKMENNLLQITFGCDCAGNAFSIGSRFLTVNITDQNTQTVDNLALNSTRALRKPWHASSDRASSDLQVRRPKDLANGIDTTISSGIARATYAGFLQLTEADALQREKISEYEKAENVEFNLDEIGVQSQINAPTSLQGIVEAEAKFPCDSIATSLAKKWRKNGQFSLQSGVIHSQIANALDEKIDGELIELAITLLGYGIGIEAETSLANLEAQDEKSAALVYMAITLDGTIAPSPIGFESCSENLKLWSFINGQHDITEEDVDPRMLMMAFKSLPDMLRVRLTSRFIDALKENNLGDNIAEIETFANTFEIARSSDHNHTPPLLDFDAPLTVHERVRSGVSEPKALLISNNHEDTAPLDPNLLDTIVFERRGAGAQTPLIKEVLSQYVSQKRYGAALELLSANAHLLSQTEHASLVEMHLASAFTNMDDADVLAFAFQSNPPTTSQEVIRLVEDRIIQMNMRPPSHFQRSSDLERSKTDQVARNTVAQDPNLDIDILNTSDQNPTFQGAIPSYFESSQLLSDSSELRSSIERLVINIQ